MSSPRLTRQPLGPDTQSPKALRRLNGGAFGEGRWVGGEPIHLDLLEAMKRGVNEPLR